MAIDCSPEEQKRLMVSAGNLNGQAGAQGGDAGDVHPLLGFGHGAAQDDVFDFFGVELQDAVESAFDGDGRKFIGTSGAERAFEGASHGSADRGSNDDFAHGIYTVMYSVMALGAGIGSPCWRMPSR